MIGCLRSYAISPWIGVFVGGTEVHTGQGLEAGAISPNRSDSHPVFCFSQPRVWGGQWPLKALTSPTSHKQELPPKAGTHSDIPDPTLRSQSYKAL